MTASTGANAHTGSLLDRTGWELPVSADGSWPLSLCFDAKEASELRPPYAICGYRWYGLSDMMKSQELREENDENVE